MKLKNVNSLCKKCAKFGRDCCGMPENPWTGCAMRVAPDKAYIIRLRGQWYALMMDTFAHYVFGIGPDAERFARIESTRGSCAGRDDAIMATCTPCETWKKAYTLARDTGRFIGELYTDKR